MIISGTVILFLLTAEVHPSEFVCKVIMLILVTTSMIKTFYVLRIFESFSYLVTMICQVFKDIREFLVLYFIFLWFFALFFAIIGVANAEVKGQFKEKYNGKVDEETAFFEYQSIGYLLGNLVNTFRLSQGDFDFSQKVLITTEEDRLYWILFVGIFVVSNIICLNFIIAEVSTSYANVMEHLEASQYINKSELVLESERMNFNSSTNNANRYPKFIVVRKVE